MNNSDDLNAADIDTIVGERIRRRRVLLGLTQDQLGDVLGISYQQIQKYETGANRVSAGRLFQIAKTLQTNVGWFFEGHGDAVADDDVSMSSRHVIDLVRGFNRIDDEKVRANILSLVRSLGNVEPDGAVAEPSEAGKSISENARLS